METHITYHLLFDTTYFTKYLKIIYYSWFVFKIRLTITRKQPQHCHLVHSRESLTYKKHCAKTTELYDIGNIQPFQLAINQ